MHSSVYYTAHTIAGVVVNSTNQGTDAPPVTVSSDHDVNEDGGDGLNYASFKKMLSLASSQPNAGDRNNQPIGRPIHGHHHGSLYSDYTEKLQSLYPQCKFSIHD